MAFLRRAGRTCQLCSGPVETVSAASRLPHIVTRYDNIQKGHPGVNVLQSYFESTSPPEADVGTQQGVVSEE